MSCAKRSVVASSCFPSSGNPHHAAGAAAAMCGLFAPAVGGSWLTSRYLERLPVFGTLGRRGATHAASAAGG